MKKKFKLNEIRVKSFTTGRNQQGGTETLITIPECRSWGQHTACTFCCPIDPSWNVDCY